MNDDTRNVRSEAAPAEACEPAAALSPDGVARRQFLVDAGALATGIAASTGLHAAQPQPNVQAPAATARRDKSARLSLCSRKRAPAQQAPLPVTCASSAAHHSPTRKSANG